MKNKQRIVFLLLCLYPLLMCGQNTLSALENIYSVKKGETWESIATDHSVSASELQAANPDIGSRKLKKGMLLIIPKTAPTTPSQEEAVESSPSEETNANQPSPLRTSITDLKVGVLLPFSEGKMVEFYRGFLMAADSVRKNGVNLDIYAWDCGSTTAQIESLLPKLTGIDVLFGPASATQIPAVAEVCREQGTRLVLPFWNGQSLLDYPLVYNAAASRPVLYNAAVKKLIGFYATANYVVVHSGTPDNRGKILSEILTQSLAQSAVIPRVLELEGNDFAYESAFNQFRNNLIFLDDSSVRSLNILLANLKDFRQKHPQYRFSLIGYPEWQDETQRLLGDFYTSDAYIISPYYYDVFAERIKRFQNAYETSFHTPIAQNNPRSAALGFDLGLYFLGGISRLGDTFEQEQGSLLQEPYQNRFQFERSASGMSFSNNFVHLIHFTPENKIELIR